MDLQWSSCLSLNNSKSLRFYLRFLRLLWDLADQKLWQTIKLKILVFPCRNGKFFQSPFSGTLSKSKEKKLYYMSPLCFRNLWMKRNLRPRNGTVPRITHLFLLKWYRDKPLSCQLLKFYQFKRHFTLFLTCKSSCCDPREVYCSQSRRKSVLSSSHSNLRC